MVETALHNLLRDVPRAAVVWLALLLLAAIALASLLTRPGRVTNDIGPIRAAVRRRARLAAQAQDLDRYAREVAVAARGAAATATRRRAEWLAAQDEAETAWQAYDAAETAARRLAGAVAFRVPDGAPTAAERAERAAFLRRAALAACARRELPVLELSDALGHRNGWDPRRHPVEQETMLRRVARDGWLAAHRTATAREREAWRAAETAAAAARSLREEAYAAAERALDARRWLPAVAPAESALTEPTLILPKLAVPMQTRTS